MTQDAGNVEIKTTVEAIVNNITSASSDNTQVVVSTTTEYDITTDTLITEEQATDIFCPQASVNCAATIETSSVRKRTQSSYKGGTTLVVFVTQQLAVTDTVESPSIQQVAEYVDAFTNVTGTNAEVSGARLAKVAIVTTTASVSVQGEGSLQSQADALTLSLTADLTAVFVSTFGVQ